MGNFAQESRGRTSGLYSRNDSRPADALRVAQLEMSRDRRWAAPFYWAGFVLQGEWR